MITRKILAQCNSRGLYQETILPDVAFIGGGGELAYWLGVQILFDHYEVPFPVLILRNSFLVIEPHWKEKLKSSALKRTIFSNRNGSYLITW
jgi:uncharacterized protein YllA (UPF0747 family)